MQDLQLTTGLFLDGHADLNGQYKRNGVEILRRVAGAQNITHDIGSTTVALNLLQLAGYTALPANFLKWGTTLLIRARGDFTCVNGATLNLALKLGNTTLGSLAFSPGAAYTNNHWEFQGHLRVKATGATGSCDFIGNAFFQTTVWAFVGMTPAIGTPLATDGELALRLEAHWSASGSNAMRCFTASVEALDMPDPVLPWIGFIPDQSTTMNTDTPIFTIRVGDADTAASSLIFGFWSHTNTGLVNLPSGYQFGGSGDSRISIITPATGQTGTSTITYYVQDGAGNRAFRSFKLTVT